MDYKSLIDTSNIPSHIAIIMDGNGRWAKEHKKPRVFGHKNGVKSVRSVVEGAGEMGVKHLTLYAFSTENWNRPKFEINALMQLLVTTISSEINALNENNVRLSTIGDIGSLPKNCEKELKKAVEKTKNNTGLNLILALSYSAKWEIIKAVKTIANDAINDKIDTKNIDDKVFQSYLETSAIKNPELLIRTGGEHRISNFLLWQIAYAELYFTDKLWPEFNKEDLFEAILNFQKRERRFGMTSEQLTTK